MNFWFEKWIFGSLKIFWLRNDFWLKEWILDSKYHFSLFKILFLTLDINFCQKIIFGFRLSRVTSVSNRNELGKNFRFSFWKLWNLIKSINSFAIFDIPPSWRLGSTIASNRKFHLIRQNCGDSICQTLEKIATRWREDPRSVLIALI